MELETQKIINLHKIDVRLQEIEEEKGDLPEIIQDQKDELETLNVKIIESDSKIKELEKEKAVFNISIADFESNLDKYNKQMDSVRNNKEYDALLIEIDHLKKENNEITDKIIEVEQSVEDLIKFKDDCNSKISKINEQLIADESELQETTVEFSVEEKLLSKNKKELLSDITDKDFLFNYNEGHKEMLTYIYNGSCNNCYTSLPAQILVDAKKGKLVSCPSCSIFLYSENDK
jgi:uncharacterized protein